ncbi:MAG TPA: GAF domain-containing protein [Roseiflexaceae bacterium]|nr:GAF domain-containing protein [Roseiflexaceae bacterium]
MPETIRNRFSGRVVGVLTTGSGAALALLLMIGLPHSATDRAALVLLAAAALGGLLWVLHSTLALRDGLAAVTAALRDTHYGQPSMLDTEHLPPELRPLTSGFNRLSDQLANQQRNLRDQLRRTALLTRLSIELREALEPPAVVRDILTVILSSTSAESASIILIGPDGSTDLAMSMHGSSLNTIPGERVRRVLEQGLAGWVLRHGGSVLLNDSANDPRWINFDSSPPIGSAVSLPLSHSRVILGVLTISHAERDQFSSHDLLLLEGVAAQVGVALSAAQRYVEERRQREQALLLFAMSQFLTSERSAADLTEELLDKSNAVFDAQRIELFLRGTEGEQLLSTGRRAAPAHDPLLDAPCATAAAEACHSREVAIRTLPEQGGTPRYCIALPLLHNGNAIGAFVLAPPPGSAPVLPARVWSLLTIFTNVAAAAFANLRLVEQLHLRAERLEELVSERTFQLQRSRDLLRVVFDHLPDGLVLLDDQHRVLAANEAFCGRVLALAPQQAVGLGYNALIGAACSSGRLRPEEQGPGETTPPMVCDGPQGQRRWYEINRYVIDGPAAQTLERWRDITRREELHRELLLYEQQAALGRLAASVVHEVGNPLQGVRSCLDLCREDPGLPQSAAEYLDMANSELERINQQLDRWRDLYRPSQLVWQQVDLNRLVAATQQLTAREMHKRRIALRTALAEDLPPVRGQPDALRQVLLNLLLNAQEAMPNGGLIEIMTCQDTRRRMICFSIVDSGQHRARLDPLLGGGAGGQPQQLGLHLSREIVQKHGGTISVSSAAETGTAVTVWLPWSEGDDGKGDTAAGG